MRTSSPQILPCLIALTLPTRLRGTKKCVVRFRRAKVANLTHSMRKRIQVQWSGDRAMKPLEKEERGKDGNRGEEGEE